MTWAVVVGVTGCNVSKRSASELFSKLRLPGQTPSDDGPKIGPTKVITDATALALELPESDLRAREQFLQRFHSLQSDGKDAAADRWVARNLDHAHQVLVHQATPDDRSLLPLARAYDKVCGTGSTWSRLIDAGPNEAFDAYQAARKQVMGQVMTGDFAGTQTTDLVTLAQATQHDVLKIDAGYQNGVLALLRDEHSTAADAFESAAVMAGDRHGVLGPLAHLMASESHRRAGDFAKATTQWDASVRKACLVLTKQKVTDVVYWDRAAYLQPIGTPWPSLVATTLKEVASNRGQPGQLGQRGPLQTELLEQLSTCPQGSITSACWIEAALGSWRDQRRESQKALVHLKKAESLTENAEAKDWLKIAQAPLLVGLGQKGLATTLLAPIIAREDNSPRMLAAMSKLGVMKLSGGSPQHGVRLLHRAVVDSGGVQWPGVASAQADLALGMFMIGENAEGRVQLEQAQTRFQADGDYEQLAQSLRNEQRYLEHSEAEKESVAAVKRRLDSLRM
ncbi:MAG: hypothetical protein AAF958_02805 [Planctomycetota bacterium]